MKKLIALTAAAIIALSGPALAFSGTKTSSTTASGQELSLNAQQIQLLQYALSDLGYNPGPLDGVWGKSTMRAVAAYQRDSSASASGTPSAAEACYLLRVGVANHGSAARLPGWCSNY